MELPSDARLEYNLIIDDAEFLAVDPLNPFKSLNGLGELSELTMPEYVHHPLFREYRSGKKGGFDRVQSHEIPAGALGYSHTVHVYLPPEYASENGRILLFIFRMAKITSSLRRCRMCSIN